MSRDIIRITLDRAVKPYLNVFKNTLSISTSHKLPDVNAFCPNHHELTNSLLTVRTATDTAVVPRLPCHCR